ncbi:hypothetical protein N8368_04530 [Bacteroidia bacterium]|nr:hypothetical protein [Bacteroidia bacterium]
MLFSELTINENNEYVLIITPDGIKDGLIPTQSLASQASSIENWTIIKFRQPTDYAELSINGVEYPLSDIEIIPEIRKNENIVDVHVFIRNMERDEIGYQHLAFLYFDHVLGEFKTITRVGYIDFHHLDGS